MIRQHFFPKNGILKRQKKDKKIGNDSENELPFYDKTRSHNLILMDPELTEPLQDDMPNNQRKHYSLLRPMQSTILQNKPKKRRIEDKHFLI